MNTNLYGRILVSFHLHPHTPILVWTFRFIYFSLNQHLRIRHERDAWRVTSHGRSSWAAGHVSGSGNGGTVRCRTWQCTPRPYESLPSQTSSCRPAATWSSCSSARLTDGLSTSTSWKWRVDVRTTKHRRIRLEHRWRKKVHERHVSVCMFNLFSAV